MWRRSIQLRGAVVARGRGYATGQEAQSSIRRNALLAVGALTAAGIAYYYETQLPSRTSGDSFDVTIRSRNGPTSYTFQRLPETAIEKRLHENETSEVVGSQGNPVVKWDRNWVGANEPCEDRSAIDLVPSKSGKDLMLFSVLDGHAGGETSELLRKTLHPTLALALGGLKMGWWTPWNRWTSENISRAIQRAYLELDDQICQGPIRLLPGLLKAPNPAFTALTQPAISGSCAISTIVDGESDAVYVALAGDCRAVAGWELEDGSWRCDVLTEDQMGENPREVARMLSEHPASEKDSVIRRGRVQGGLQPTRAFGDAVYKWTRAQNDAIDAIFSDDGLKTRKQRPDHLTPPYVTARPEVTVRRITRKGEKLRFIVMATDGLWDRITSEEATLLLAAYTRHPTNPDISKAELPTAFPLAPPPKERLYPEQTMPGEGDRMEGSWVFEGDDNAATHLIRNSLGNRKERGELLSMKGDVTRWKRDDCTVTVIFFGDEMKER